jgi:hypothetical protein
MAVFRGPRETRTFAGAGDQQAVPVRTWHSTRGSHPTLTNACYRARRQAAIAQSGVAMRRTRAAARLAVSLIGHTLKGEGLVRGGPSSAARSTIGVN